MKKESKNKWFGRKKYGYGFRPNSTAGWAVVLIYVVAIFLNFTVALDPAENIPLERMFFFGFLTILLILISYRMGEKPRWQWRGKPIKK